MNNDGLCQFQLDFDGSLERENDWCDRAPVGAASRPLAYGQAHDRRPETEPEPEARLIQWHTGRNYDHHGQRMVLKMMRHEILFSDLGRSINGCIPLGNYFHAHRREDTWVLKQLVMSNYDLGNYGYSPLTLPWTDDENTLQVCTSKVIGGSEDQRP